MLRRFGMLLASGGLALAILAGLLSLAINRTALLPGPVHDALIASGVYGQVAPYLLDEAKGETVAGVTLDDPAVRQAAQESFSADYVARVVEPGVDNTFTWLRGDIEQPDFKLDYKEGRRDFAGRVGDIAASQAGDLPACSPIETLRLGSQFRGLLAEGNIGDITCLPPGVSPGIVSQVVSRYVETGLGNNSALAEGMVPASQVTINGQPFYEHPQVARLPGIVALLSWLPWLSLAVALVCLAAIYALRRNNHVLVSRAAICLVASGLVAAVIAVSLRPLARRLTDGNMDETASAFAVALAGTTGDWLRTAAVLTVLLGAALLILVQWRTFKRLKTKNRAT